MNIGDPIYTGDLEFTKTTLLLGNLPKLVAEKWFLLHSGVLMNSQGVTNSEQPIKNWEIGYGVVIGFTGDGKPVFLTKSGGVIGGEYSLWSYDITVS